ncbi:MAG: hypothetical protein AAB527_02840 [Patescibacteria group bacterium]
MHRYWTGDDIIEVEEAKDFTRLAQIALKVIGRIPDPIVQVCGPITSGGFASVELNLKVFEMAIDSLERKGFNVFDQMPLENAMARIQKENYTDPDKARVDILNQVYLPIFESGRIKMLAMLPGWQDSIGAVWERDQGIRLGILVLRF